MNSSAESIEAKERREALWKEILYRREKQWSIFSWTTSLLLAAIAGVVATTTKEGFELSLSQKVFLAITLLLLFLYAVIWLHENIRREEQATTLIRRIDAEFGIGDIFLAGRPFYFGYQFLIVGIGVVAILTVIFAPVRMPYTTSLTFMPAGKPALVLTIPSREQRFDDIGAAVAAFQEEVKKHHSDTQNAP